MKNHKLASYKNLCDWGVRACPSHDDEPLPAMKDRFLDELNSRLKTKYRRNHLDNWLAERAATPKRVCQFLVDELLAVEVESQQGDLGVELRRLFKTYFKYKPSVLK